MSSSQKVYLFFFWVNLDFFWGRRGGLEVVNLTYLGLTGVQTVKITLHIESENLEKKIQFFQRFKNVRRFRVLVLSYRANFKRQKRQKIYKSSFQWQINEWGAIFRGLSWSFRWKIFKKYHLDKEFFSRKKWMIFRAIVWEK